MEKTAPVGVATLGEGLASSLMAASRLSRMGAAGVAMASCRSASAALACFTALVCRALPGREVRPEPGSAGRVGQGVMSPRIALGVLAPIHHGEGPPASPASGLAAAAAARVLAGPAAGALHGGVRSSLGVMATRPCCRSFSAGTFSAGGGGGGVRASDRMLPRRLSSSLGSPREEVSL